MYVISAGRLGLGFLMQLSWTNTVMVHAAAVFITGASQIIWGFWVSEVGMVVCAAVFGCSVVSYGCTWSEVTMLITGEDLFPLAVGYSMLIMGPGWMIGAPVAGKHTLIQTIRYIVYLFCGRDTKILNLLFGLL